MQPTPHMSWAIHPNHIQERRIQMLQDTADMIFSINTGATSPASQEIKQAAKVCKKKEENKMCIETQFNLDEERINYLTSQLETAFWQKDLKLEEKFGMREVRPSNIEEGIEWIKAGKFSLKEDEGYGGFWNRLRWQQVPKDRKGWEKASEALRLAQQTAQDTITLKSSDEGLKALNDFRAWQYSA